MLSTFSGGRHPHATMSRPGLSGQQPVQDLASGEIVRRVLAGSVPCMQMEAQALRGLLHMLILSVLLDGPLHPYAIQQVLQEHAETFTFGNDAVYTSMRRLADKGLVTSIKVLVNGRTRRIYEISPAGRDQLATDWAVWEEFTRVVRGIVCSSQAGERREQVDPARSRA